MHKETAEKIGNKINIVHKESLWQCVMAHRYLRGKGRYFNSKPNYDGFLSTVKPMKMKFGCNLSMNVWLNFVKKCSLLDHVIGNCKFDNTKMMTTTNGVTARVYGP